MTQGLELLKQVVTEIGPIFTVEQARSASRDRGLDDSQLYWALSELARSDWITRLKRGVYAVRPPLTGSDLHPFAIAAAIVQPLAISHWSALAHHGLTTQIPPMVQASTTRAVVTPEMRQGRAFRPRGHAVWNILEIEFEFITVKPENWFGLQQEWVSPWHRVSITDPERTLLDTFAHPGLFGSIGAAMSILENAWEQIDLERLVQYALQYNVGALIKRLGWTLDKLGAPPAILEPLRTFAVRSVYLLDPARPAGGTTVTTWQVRDNLQPTEAS
jgi:predicted transcriptional regulator of viral defense system